MQKKRKICDDWWRRANDSELTADFWLCYYIIINSLLLRQGKGQRDAGKKGIKKSDEWRSPRHKQSPPNSSVFFWLTRRVPGYQFNLPWVFLNATIARFLLFVRASWEGSIKTKIRQFDGCLLISRPLRLWLPNIKPAITGQSSHLHLHTPNSWIGSN